MVEKAMLHYLNNHTNTKTHQKWHSQVLERLLHQVTKKQCEMLLGSILTLEFTLLSDGQPLLMLILNKVLFLLEGCYGDTMCSVTMQEFQLENLNSLYIHYGEPPLPMNLTLENWDEWTKSWHFGCECFLQTETGAIRLI